MRSSCCSVVVGGGRGLGAEAARGACLRALGFVPGAGDLAPEAGGFASEAALFRDLLGDFFFCAIA